jgi:hypothetical protein
MIGLAVISTEILRREGGKDQIRRLLMRPGDAGEIGFTFRKTESLRGGLSRAFARAGLSNSWTMLREAGLKHRNRVIVSEDPNIDIGALAEALQVSREEILHRRYPEVSLGIREFFGLQIPHSNFETRTRQFSPTYLREFGHHHAAWELKFLPFCPETYDVLQTTCMMCKPETGHTQGWTRTLTPVDCCDECGRRLGNQPAHKVPEHMRPALNIVARIVSPDLTKRKTFAEFIPTQLTANSPQQMLDAILGLTRHLAIPKSRRDEDGRLVRLHLACEAVSKWPTGLDHLDFTASKTGAILPPLMRQYAALGVEPPSVVGKTALNWPRVNAASDTCLTQKFNAGSHLVGLARASRLAGLSSDLLHQVWNSGLLTRRYRFHGTKMLPAFDTHELVFFADAWKARVSAASVGQRLGIPAYGLEQCALLNVFPPHDLTLINDGYYFDPQLIDETLNRLKQRSVAVSGNLVSIRGALRRTSGGVKPWGFLLKALLEGILPFKYNSQSGEKLSGCLLVSQACMLEQLPNLMEKAASSVTGLTSQISQKDALEILNCGSSSLGMFDGIDGQGVNPLLYPLEKIIARSQECMATIEFAEQLGIGAAAAYCILRDARVAEVVPGGWHRAQAKILIDRVADTRKAQLLLLSAGSPTIEMTAVANEVGTDRVRISPPCANLPMRSRNSDIAKRIHRPQLSLSF